MTRARKTEGFPLVSAGVALALVLLMVLGIMTLDRAPRLERSAMGMDGLGLLLEREGLGVRQFSGGGALSPDGISLRVLPLYTTRLSEFVLPFGTVQADPHLQANIRPISRAAVTQKLRTLPTLIIYPKWRDGVRRTGLLHPEFLALERGETDLLPALSHSSEDALDDAADVEGETIRAPLRLPRIQGPSRDVVQAQSIILPYEYGGDTVELVAPQWASVPENCASRVGEADRALVLSCRWDGHEFWVVSDPDLLNNYGLMQAGNAPFAVSLVEQLAAGGDVLLDYSVQAWLSDDARRGRSWRDLLRYFEPPFLWAWLAALMLFLLVFWRGSVRDRPAMQPFSFAHGAARRTVLQAQARLMRQTRRDGALVRTIAALRVHTLCRHFLGREGRGADPAARLIDVIAGKNTDIAARFATRLAEIAELPDRLSPEAASAELARLETVYEEVLELV